MGEEGIQPRHRPHAYHLSPLEASQQANAPGTHPQAYKCVALGSHE